MLYYIEYLVHLLFECSRSECGMFGVSKMKLQRTALFWYADAFAEILTVKAREIKEFRNDIICL